MLFMVLVDIRQKSVRNYLITVLTQNKWSEGTKKKKNLKNKHGLTD